MSEATVGIAKPEDIRQIQVLYRQLDDHHADLLPDVFQPLDQDARSDDVIRAWIGRDDADYLLAEVNGEVVGFLNVKEFAHPTYPMFRPHEFAMIENAVVERAHRGKGIGTKLFHTAIAWAQNRGIRYVQTLVWYANEGAQEFYIEHGFKPLTQKLELDLRKESAEPAHSAGE